MRERAGDWFHITEAQHEPGLQLETHTHRFPAVTLVRRGSFGLEIGNRTIPCTDAGVLFKLGDQPHANVVGPSGSRSLILEIRSDERRARGAELPLPDSSFWYGRPTDRHLATAIAGEFGRADAASPLALEGLVIELLAGLLRRGWEPDTARPRWLDEVDELLHTRFREGIRLGEVAAIVGRHPAHLARTYRRHRGCSLGQRVRSLQLEHAARALVSSGRSIADIALEAGFYDQAHFGRCFKAWSGRSPHRYRVESRTG